MSFLSLLQPQLHLTEIQAPEGRKFLTELFTVVKFNKYEEIIFSLHLARVGARGSVVVKAPCYKPEGCGFETQ
jgi:hypothetical protein